MIRDPFPNNVIPRDRIFNPDGSYKNPLMALYSKMVPQPNQNFVENGQQPTGNFYQGDATCKSAATWPACGSITRVGAGTGSFSGRAVSPRPPT